MRIGIWELNWQTIIIAVVTLAALLVITNQAFSLIYKVQLLSSPCELCVKLNPEWAKCYKELTTPTPIIINYSNSIDFSKFNLTS